MMFGYNKYYFSLFLLNLLISQDCNDSEIYLWENCYSIDSTISINLVADNINGQIPSDIGNLINLEYLNLSANNLTGSIPSEIGNLISLNYLYLQNNDLSGTIPTEIGNLTELIGLKLYSNQLTGSIPLEIGNLENLTNLSLFLNNLSGPIPEEIGNLVNLEDLYLYRNNLSGSIPAQIGNLTSLVRLFLHGNSLSGSIPNEIGNLTNLASLFLYENNLEGLLPSNIVKLSNLTNLWLYNNQLTGELPCNICEMQIELDNPSYVKIFDNQFCGPYPNCMLDNIGIQDTTNCSLIAESQFYIWDQCYIVADTDSLDRSNNGLTGSIPSEIGNLINLEYLFLNGNELSGEIPSNIGNLENLKELYLYDNDLSGPIPSELSNLSNLTHFFLYNNQLSGTFPAELNSLENLEYLYINDNQFNGQLSESICDIALNWSNSLLFNFSENSFCSPYPYCLDGAIGYQDTSSCNDILSAILMPEEPVVFSAYPNPFNPYINISYYLPKTSLVQIKIYNIAGEVVKNLSNRYEGPGKVNFRWDAMDELGRKVSSGTYIYAIRIENFLDTRKIVLMK